ncbi:MAG: high-affinity branched-chain amino acid ABC transporter permease LivM [Thalassospira sp.]|nr:high-affinity branched-chain amino acid ABC transporter permease LivM [Thalassospira sp.]
MIERARSALRFAPLALVALPLLLNRTGLDLASIWLLYVGLALGISIVIQRTGLLDLGYAAYYAIGAYCYALLGTVYGVSFWLCLPLAALLAAFVAALVGTPLLRLKGDYFAIGTLGFAEILNIFIRNEDWLTGGANGLSDVPRPTLFGLDFARTPGEGLRSFHEAARLDFSGEQRLMFYYFIILGIVGLLVLLHRRLAKSNLGRAFEAVREDEIACQALGLNVARLKIAAYSMAAAIGGIMGCFFAAKQCFVSPESFGFMESITVLAIAVLGGGRPLGIMLAALVLVLIPELARDLQDYRMVFFGAILVVVMLLRPQGLGGLRTPSVTARMP